MDGDIVPSLSDSVGLFPLPNVVLLPGATLPLHIHEPRYRHLVQDSIEDNAMMAMAFLLPGYEPHYHTLMARIHPVVCLGLIRECVQTSDGRFLINLVGICRAKVLDEDRSGDYRRAYVEPIVATDPSTDEDAEFAAMQLCHQILNAPAFDGTPAVQRLRKVCGNSMSLEQMVDLMAAAVLPAESVEVRQLILSEANVLQRTEVLLSELQALARTLQLQRKQADDALPGSLMN